MKQITRNIDPSRARDLLTRVPRACISFAGEQGLQALPVMFVWLDERYLVGFPGNGPQPGPGQEVVILIDEGIHFFDLRVIYIRGYAQPVSAPRNVWASCIWFEVIPLKTTAWDYGALREVDDECR